MPKQLVPFFLRCYHDQSGHLSYNYVSENISKYFYFENLYSIVRDYIAKCTICQKDTTNRHQKPVLADLIELTDIPFFLEFCVFPLFIAYCYSVFVLLLLSS